MDKRWSYFEVTAPYLEQKAEWLKEERNLHHSSVPFFCVAGKLVSLSRDDYELASVAFFHAIIGLESAIKLHFSKEPYPSLATENFKPLFRRAVKEGIVTDAVFSEVKPFSEGLEKRIEEEQKKQIDDELQVWVDKELKKQASEGLEERVGKKQRKRVYEAEVPVESL